MSPEYFDFANKPKGILPFHKYKTRIATAIEEHLYECANYSSSNGNSNLHFTVSETHQILFENIVKSIQNRIEKETETTINISYSFQKKSTDTIAVDVKNKPLGHVLKLIDVSDVFDWYPSFYQNFGLKVWLVLLR